MLGAGAGVVVRAAGAQRAEHRVARLAEQQLLVDVYGALGYDLAALPRHEVQQLVDEERGWQRLHAAPRYGDELAAYRAAERAGVAGLRGRYAGQAVQADGVGALEELGGVFVAVVHAWKKNFRLVVIKQKYHLSQSACFMIQESLKQGTLSISNVF